MHHHQISDPQTMAALFRNVATRFPRREALVADNARLTFTELDERTDALARALVAHGFGNGAIVATLLLDGLAMVELAIATAKSGSTLLALNWRLAPAELRYILEDSAPRLCFVSDGFADLFAKSGGENPVIVSTGDVRGAKLDYPAGVSPETIIELPEIHRSDRWFMLYTSGTTGKPKGCQHTQGGYFVNVLSWLGQLGVSERDTLLSTSPLFHVHGFGTLLCALVAGMKTVIPPRGADAEQVLKLTASEAVSVQHLWSFPVEYLETLGRLDIKLKLRLLIAGGGAVPTEFIKQLVEWFQVDMRFVYGQTEAGCWLTMLGLPDQLERPKSCGRLMPHLQGRLVDDKGEDVPEGSVGELWVKGETITTGYLNLPDATAETITEGWLHTGDLCTTDGEGFYYISGRKKELIKTGGENVYPAEVDAALFSHPGIVDVCVVGVPDERWGEAVKAFVVRAPEADLTAQEVADWCKSKIAGYKRPRYVEFVEAIPRDFNQKPQRRHLADRPNGPELAVS